MWVHFQFHGVQSKTAPCLQKHIILAVCHKKKCMHEKNIGNTNNKKETKLLIKTTVTSFLQICIFQLTKFRSHCLS